MIRTISRLALILILLSALSIPLFAQSCASGSDLQPTQLFTEVTSKTGTASAFLTYENFSTSPPRKPVNYAPLIAHIYNDSWDGEVVRFYTNFNGEAALDLKKYVPSTEGGCYTVDFIFCSPESFDTWQCLEANGISSTLLQPYKDSATASGVVNNQIYAIAHIPADTSLFSDTLKPWLAGQLATEGYRQTVPMNLKTISDTQQYCPIPEKPSSPSLGFCLPLILIFALLGAGMFMKGQNPFGGFDFSTPRMGKLHARYGGARGRGAFFDIAGTYSSVKGAAEQGKADLGEIKAAKSFTKAAMGAVKSDIKAFHAGITASKKDLIDAKKGGESPSVASAALAKLGLAGGGGRRKLQFFGVERVTGADGIVARVRTMRHDIDTIKKKSESEVGGFKPIIGTIAASVIGRTEFGLVRSEKELKEDFTSHAGGVAGAENDLNGLNGTDAQELPKFSLENKSAEPNLLGVSTKLELDTKDAVKIGLLFTGPDSKYKLFDMKPMDPGVMKSLWTMPMFNPFLRPNVQIVRDGMLFSMGGKIDMYGKFGSDGRLIVKDGRSGEEVTIYKRDENGNFVFNKDAVKKGWDEGKATKALGAISEKAASALHTIVADAKERQDDSAKRLVAAAMETGGLVENLKKGLGKLKDEAHTAEDAMISARPLARLIEKADANRERLTGLEAEQREIPGRIKEEEKAVSQLKKEVAGAKAELDTLNAAKRQDKEKLAEAQQKYDGLKQQYADAVQGFPVLQTREKVLGAEIVSAKNAVAGDDAELKKYGGYTAIKITVTAAELNRASAQEKLAERTELISGLETGSLLNNPELAKKVVGGKFVGDDIKLTPEVRKAVIEHLAASAIVADAEGKARPLVMLSRDLKDGNQTSGSINASLNAMQTFGATQAKVASAVATFENSETLHGAVSIMEKVDEESMSETQKAKAKTDRADARESASVLGAISVSGLFTAEAVGKRNSAASQTSLERYLFAKEAATTRSTGELMREDEKQKVAQKEGELAKAFEFLAVKPAEPPALKVSDLKEFGDVKKNLEDLKTSETTLSAEALKAEYETSILRQMSTHLEAAAEELIEIKREGKEGTAPARLDVAIGTARESITGINKSKTLEEAAVKAGWADLGVALASLGGRNSAPILEAKINMDEMLKLQNDLNAYEKTWKEHAERKLELEKTLVGEELKEFDAKRLQALEKKPEDKLSGEERKELATLRTQRELRDIDAKGRVDASEIHEKRAMFNELKLDYENSLRFYGSLKELTTAARDSEYLRDEKDRARVADWVDRITGTAREEGKPAEAKGDIGTTFNAVMALTETLSGKNLDNLSDEQRKEHVGVMMKVLDMKHEAQDPSAIQHPISVAATYHELAVKTSTAKPDELKEIIALGKSYSEAVAKGDAQAQAVDSSHIHARRFTTDSADEKQYSVLLKAPGAELQQWAEKHSDGIEKSPVVAEAYKNYLAAVEHGTQNVSDQYGRTQTSQFIDAVSKHMDDKSIDNFVKEQYVRQWIAGSHGQDVTQHAPDLQKAVQAFQTRTTNDMEYEKHVDELYQTIQMGDKPFKEQRISESFKSTPTFELTAFAEQHKESFKGDKELEKAHHDFEIAQNTLSMARETYTKNPTKQNHETVEKAEHKLEKERTEFTKTVSESHLPEVKQAVSEHVERELRKAEGELHGTISQHETEHYLNTDWDAARLSIQSKLTQYHKLPDKSSDDAVKLERAVLEDVNRLSGSVDLSLREAPEVSSIKLRVFQARSEFGSDIPDKEADRKSVDIVAKQLTDSEKEFLYRNNEKLFAASQVSQKLGLSEDIYRDAGLLASIASRLPKREKK